jgi:uncharacterized protein (TIGR01777 family)
MRVVISGASGMIGGALSRHLSGRGHEVVGLSRSARPGWLRWDPARGELDPTDLAGAGAIVHLAGKSLLDRWTPDSKRAMWGSRVDSGRLLAEAAARMDTPPRVYVTCSAVGYYGDRGDEVLDESSARGIGFLAELCEAWEAAAAPAADAGLRVAAVRTGVVLQALTGQLKLPFSLGLGARLGSGRQWLSWVLLEDLVGLYTHVIESEDVRGPLNGVAPEPATNAAFTQALARALGRPAFLAAPEFALKAILGAEMAAETLLASQRAVPARALEQRFTFGSPTLETALPRALGRAGA